MNDRRRAWLKAALLFAVGTLAYAAFVIRDFSGPLIGTEDYDGTYRGDSNYFEFLGYYVRDHWHFGLRPIAFFTTDVAYPAGTHIGLLSWCAERDLFCAAMLKLFGPGPWVQTYLTAGALLGAVGITVILSREYEVFRSALVGFAASFMSFYAWYKYPYHLNMAALHWVTMSLAADLVTMKRVVEGKRLSLPFIVFRAALLVLSLGLDLGYVAGHALSSFCVTTYCAWSELGKRDRHIFGRLRLAFPESFADLRARSGAVAGGLVLVAFGVAFYLPFIAAVVRDTSTYPMTRAGSEYWASWFHALFPYLPGVHPNSSLVRSIFGSDEGVGEYAPGFALLTAGGVGLWLAHKRDRSAVVKPLFVTALLVFAFHPRWCKTLQIFPWFAYDRVAGRGTIVLPTFLALIAVAMPEWPRRAKQIVAALGVAEFATAVFLVSAYRPARFLPEHRAYFDAIRSSPGQAILDWPFCIASANSDIAHHLCPEYRRVQAAYANRRFHEKSTMSVYLSRVHETQFTKWIDERWEDMLLPATSRCFTDAEWEKFDALYRGHDFAGIQLSTGILPSACVDAFHARYGQPKATATLPRFGRLEFIPRR